MQKQTGSAFAFHTGHHYECDCGCFLKCFLLEKYIKFFFIFKKSILTSTHQNNLKTQKTII